MPYKGGTMTWSSVWLETVAGRTGNHTDQLVVFGIHSSPWERPCFTPNAVSSHRPSFVLAHDFHSILFSLHAGYGTVDPAGEMPANQQLNCRSIMGPVVHGAQHTAEAGDHVQGQLTAQPHLGRHHVHLLPGRSRWRTDHVLFRQSLWPVRDNLKKKKLFTD